MHGWIFPFLFFSGLLGGFIDTLAGGGGLLTLPALLLAGAPPLSALATNKLQGTFGTLSAVVLLFYRHMQRRQHREFWEQLCLLVFGGGLLGAIFAFWLGDDILDYVIPLILTVIAFYFLFLPGGGEIESEPRMSQRWYRRVILPLIGIYDGLLGPGTGSFFAFSGVMLRGQSLLQATIQAKFLNFSSNLAALMVFIIVGKVIWIFGAVMIVGQALGAWMATHVMLRVGARVIRPLIVLVCIGLLVVYSNKYGLLAHAWSRVGL